MGFAQRRDARIPQPGRFRQIPPEQGGLRTPEGTGKGTGQRQEGCRRKG